MKINQLNKAALLTTLLLAQQAFSADDPTGRWKTFDEDTKKAKSIVEIYKNANGTVSGKVVKLFKHSGAVCKKCDGKRKNQPIEGLTFLWGLKDTGKKWDKGEILDPQNGKTYDAEIQVINHGQSLKVTGKFLMIRRSQVWKKMP